MYSQSYPTSWSRSGEGDESDDYYATDLCDYFINFLEYSNYFLSGSGSQNSLTFRILKIMNNDLEGEADFQSESNETSSTNVQDLSD